MDYGAWTHKDLVDRVRDLEIENADLKESLDQDHINRQQEEMHRLRQREKELLGIIEAVPPSVQIAKERPILYAFAQGCIPTLLFLILVTGLITIIAHFILLMRG